MSNILINRTIQEVKIAKDKQAILFTTQEGDVVAHAWGDCCSHTWIEGVELPALGFPASVLNVEDLQMPNVAQPEYWLIQPYGLKITTDKGEIVIDYRNESNGYYGGCLIWPGDYYHDRYNQNVSKKEWENIKE